MKISDSFHNIWNHRMFGVFFLIVLLFWYFTKLSYQYTTDIIVPVEITMDDVNNGWIENPNHEININCQSDGRTILSYKLFFASNFQIPISQLVLDKIDNYNYSINGESLLRAIQAQLKDVNINYIDDSVQIIRMAPCDSNRVPIRHSINVSYAPQHMNPKGKIVLAYDSVEIVAPKMILDTIDCIRTNEITYENLSHSVKSRIQLDIPDKVICKNNSVSFEIPVERCTQYKFVIDVSVSKPSKHNNPLHNLLSVDNKSLTIIPKQVTIFLNMPLSAEAQKNDIRAYINYDPTNNQSQYDVLLDKLPVGSEIVTIEPEHVNVFKNK